MKNIVRLLLLIALILVGVSLNAQEVQLDSINYEVKKNQIFKDGIDVTKTLSEEKKTKILAALVQIQQELAQEKAMQDKLEKAEKEQKKAEKQQKRAEKEQKKAEKALKQKEKAQANYERALDKHKTAQKKYEKLKQKGKLSPVDEEKWLEKIEKLSENIAKTKRKLK